MTIDPKKLALAREWVEWMHDNPYVDGGTSTRTRATADVVSSLPDTIVDGAKVGELIKEWRTDCPTGDGPKILDQLESLLPVPPAPRTLADMTPEERKKCRWMQAEIYDDGFIGILTEFSEIRQEAKYLCPGGEVSSREYNVITPLPDLPRLEWPGNELEESEGDPAEPASPRPEDVPVGEPWQVEIDGETAIGYRNDPDEKSSWVVVYRNSSDFDYLYDTDVTLVARLVPEATEQNDETVFDPDYIYRDKDGDEWEYIDGGWFNGDTHAERVAGMQYRPGRAGLPAEYGPYTRIAEEESDA